MVEMSLDTVADVYDRMVVKPAKVNKGALMHEALQALIENPSTRTVYVLDQKDKPLGAISPRVLLRASSARFGVRKDGVFSFVNYLGDLFTESVDELMRDTTPITKKETLKKVLKIMEENKQIDLPVVDEQGRLIGELNGMEIIKLGIDVIRKGNGVPIEPKKGMDKGL